MIASLPGMYRLWMHPWEESSNRSYSDLGDHHDVWNLLFQDHRYNHLIVSTSRVLF